MAEIDVQFVLHRKGFNDEFRTWPGVVGRHLTKLNNEVATVAMVHAPGSMKTAIHTGRGHHGRDLEATVSVDHKAALMVIKGTRPHMIFPKRAPALKFYWRKVGRVVVFKHVSHPGNPANNFLLRSLKRVFKVS